MRRRKAIQQLVQFQFCLQGALESFAVEAERFNEGMEKWKQAMAPMMVKHAVDRDDQFAAMAFRTLTES